MSDRDVKSWMERISSDVEMLKRRLIRRPGGGGGAYSPRRFQSKAELELWVPEDGAHAWVEADSSEYVRAGGQWRLVSREGGAATLSRGTVWSLDTLYTVGRYRFDPSTEGLPVPGIWGFVDVVVDRGEAWNGVDNHMWQIAFSTGTVTRQFARNRVNDTLWRPWVEFNSGQIDTGWLPITPAHPRFTVGDYAEYRIHGGFFSLRFRNVTVSASGTYNLFDVGEVGYNPGKTVHAPVAIDGTTIPNPAWVNQDGMLRSNWLTGQSYWMEHSFKL